MTEASESAGILPDRALKALTQAGALSASTPIEDDQIQPASLDLRLGGRVWRLRASFLPGAGRSVEDRLKSDLVMHEIALGSDGAVLETGCVYLAEIAERFALPGDVAAVMNPKSSTGRLDVFTRVIADGASAFDQAPAGYEGRLYVEICPRTFSILARPGDRLVQARLRRASPPIGRSETLSVDLNARGDAPVGYRAKRHSPLVDLTGVGAHDPAAFWEPLHAPDGRIVLDPGEFYILASREAVQIGLDEAAEMAPIAPEIGEFRAHYAGFFDPGFGVESAGGAGARAVLEVRGRDVPFILEHGQPVAKLVYEPMAGAVEAPYGSGSSNYQAQGLKLAKHFRAPVAKD
ncbi:MAG: 2'-deoxycytidine 5'-triphosphate deaminase [Pseudomonadota bacterium]